MGLLKDGMEGKDGVLRSEITLKLAPEVETAVVGLLVAFTRFLLRFAKA